MLHASTIIRANGFGMQLLQNLWKITVWCDKINIMSDLCAGLRLKKKKTQADDLKKVIKERLNQLPYVFCLLN